MIRVKSVEGAVLIFTHSPGITGWEAGGCCCGGVPGAAKPTGAWLVRDWRIKSDSEQPLQFLFRAESSDGSTARSQRTLAFAQLYVYSQVKARFGGIQPATSLSPLERFELALTAMRDIE
jgi:hypothetical protein